MIKECPTCKRTYSDQSITFCLADGSLLSAPFDPQATHDSPVSHSSERRPTEVMNIAASSSLPPTQPAIGLKDVPPTIASPIPLHVEKQMIDDSSTTQRAVAKSIYLLSIFVGLAVGFFLRTLNRFIYSSHIPIAIGEGPLIVIAPVIAYAAVGSIFGYVWPRGRWKWGVWISAIPWLFVALFTFPLLRKPHSDTLGLFLFANLVIAPIAACLGSYFGARLSLNRIRRSDK